MIRTYTDITDHRTRALIPIRPPRPDAIEAVGGKRDSHILPSERLEKMRTSYSLMSQWLRHPSSAGAYRKKSEIPATYNIAMQGNSVFPPIQRRSRSDPANADGPPATYSINPSFAQRAAIDENVPVHLRFSESGGHDDFHKAFRQISQQWPSSSFPVFGPPRLRHGRAGGSWRHVKEVLQAGGSRTVFVDGIVRWQDTVQMDETPGGHLIQPKAEADNELKKHHYLMDSPREKCPSMRVKSEDGFGERKLAGHEIDYFFFS